MAKALKKKESTNANPKEVEKINNTTINNASGKTKQMPNHSNKKYVEYNLSKYYFFSMTLFELNGKKNSWYKGEESLR